MSDSIAGNKKEVRMKKVRRIANTNFVTNKNEVTQLVTSNGIMLQEAKIQKLEVTYLH